MKTIINARLYDFYTYIPNGYLRFEDKICDVGAMADYRPGEQDGEVIDAKGGFLLPGLIIGHAHLYGAFMRGVCLPQIHSTNFREQLEQLYWKVDGALDIESSYHSAKSLAMDHIRCGVTTIFDHHASGTEILGTLDALKKAWVDECGLRGAFCFETSDRFDVDACIRENADFAAKGSSEMHTAFFGIHASLTVSERTLAQIREAIGNTPLHAHVGESLEDEEECMARYGKRIVHRLVEHDIVKPNSIFAHCVNIDAAEADLVRRCGATAALNVTSNLNTGNGIPDYRQFKRYEVPAMLGNDSLGSNIAIDIRNTMFAMHLRTQNPWWFSYGMLLDCVRESYRFASDAFKTPIGRFETGNVADFALSGYEAPTPIDENNVWGHVVDGLFQQYRPHSVWCAGEEKMQAYEVCFDEKSITANSRKSAQRAFERMLRT